MENILAQGIFLSEQEMTEMEESENSIYAKFTYITFEEKDSTKSKMQTVEDVLKDMEINENEVFILPSMSQESLVMKKILLLKIGYSIVSKTYRALPSVYLQTGYKSLKPTKTINGHVACNKPN